MIRIAAFVFAAFLICACKSKPVVVPAAPAAIVKIEPAKYLLPELPFISVKFTELSRSNLPDYLIYRSAVIAAGTPAKILRPLNDDQFDSLISFMRVKALTEASAQPQPAESSGWFEAVFKSPTREVRFVLNPQQSLDLFEKCAIHVGMNDYDSKVIGEFDVYILALKR